MKVIRTKKVMDGIAVKVTTTNLQRKNLPDIYIQS